MNSALELAAAMKAAMDRGLENAGRQLLADAKAEAPVGTVGEDDRHPDELRDSGRLEVDAGRIFVVFGVPYAARQHEHREYHHAHGKSHYLEDPLKALIPRMDGIIFAPVRDLFGGRA